MSRILLIALLLVSAVRSRASFTSAAAGTSSAEFLRLGAGARAAGLGEAFTAVADDATAVYWNPAGLSRVESQAATFMHASYLGSSHFDYAAYARRVGNGSLGLGFQYFSPGTITQTDDIGSEVGSLSPSAETLSAGYALSLPADWPVVGGVSFGLSGKYIHSKIIETAQGAAVDAGMLTPAYSSIGLDDSARVRFAVAITNVGTPLKYDQESQPLPTMGAVGSRVELPNRTSLSLDIKAPRDDRPYVAAGIEHFLEPGSAFGLAVRAGFNTQTIGSIDGLSGLALGFGLSRKAISVDYAFVPYGGLGNAHRLSVSCTW